MENVLTTQGSDGRALQSVQPEAGSVTGSPFTVTNAASVGPTGALSGMLVVMATEPVHVRFSKDGTNATTDNMLLPANQILPFPVDADHVEFIASSTTATVYLELAKKVG